MRVDLSEITPAGPIVHAVGIDLAAALPDPGERAMVLARLAERAQALVTREDRVWRIGLSRIRPGAPAPKIFRVRLRVRPKAPAVPPSPFAGIVRRIADVMVARAGEAGACTVADLRRAGLSYRQIVTHADAARELVGLGE